MSTATWMVLVLVALGATVAACMPTWNRLSSVRWICGIVAAVCLMALPFIALLNRAKPTPHASQGTGSSTAPSGATSTPSSPNAPTTPTAQGGAAAPSTSGTSAGPSAPAASGASGGTSAPGGPASSGSPSTEQGQGVLSIRFFDGRFSYYDDGSRLVKHYLGAPLPKRVSLCVKDDKGNVVYDGSCDGALGSISVPLRCGSYVGSVTCEGYLPYLLPMNLSPGTMHVGEWTYDLHLRPSGTEYLVRVRIVDQQGVPYKQMEFAIGYGVIAQRSRTDADGYLPEVFCLVSGLYELHAHPDGADKVVAVIEGAAKEGVITVVYSPK